MMDHENFVEWDQSPFSKLAREAANQGRLRCSPLLDVLQDIHAASRGLEQIFKIANANRVQEMAWCDKDEDDESLQAPMEVNTVEALLALGGVVSKIIVNDIERVSKWLDNHGVREADPAADLAVAARAAVARARQSRAPIPATERETA
jgi:hypothetical protein